MIQDIQVLQYVDPNSTLAIIFATLTVWAVTQRLNNKKSSTLFLSMLITSSITLCAITFDNDAISNLVASLQQAKEINYVSNDVDVAFSPKQGATKLIINTIKNSEKSIFVAAYSFTSKPIADALVEAYQNGIDVKIVLDKSQRTAKYSAFLEVKNLGIPIRINSKYAIMHNKFMIVDGKILQTGSFNYSQAAENNNAENVLIISDNTKVVKQYTQKWLELWNEAQ